MKKIFYLSWLFVFLITGCTKSPKQGGLFYYNDFESIKGWTPLTLAKWPVHSGWFSNKLDSIHLYGLTFYLAFRDISPRPLRKVKISLWAYFTVKCESAIVVEIKDHDNKNVAWIGINMEEQVKEIGKWQKVTTEISLQSPAYNKPDNTISIYPWNRGKKEVYVDDISIEFEEQNTKT